MDSGRPGGHAHGIAQGLRWDQGTIVVGVRKGNRLARTGWGIRSRALRGGAKLQGSKKLYGGGQIAAHLHPKEVFAVVEREVGALICGNVAYGGGESQGCKIKIVAPHRAVLRKGGGGGGRGEEPPAPASAGRHPTEASKMTIFLRGKQAFWELQKRTEASLEEDCLLVVWSSHYDDAVVQDAPFKHGVTGPTEPRSRA